MTRNTVKCLLCLLLAVIAFAFKIPIWILFVFFALYFGYRAVKPLRPQSILPATIVPEAFGVIGSYALDGDMKDLSLGMFIHLQGRPVFISIREDEHLEARKQTAQKLHKESEKLEANLKQFLLKNPIYADRTLSSIGLHSDDLERSEVFWNPDGYTLMKGFEFVVAE